MTCCARTYPSTTPAVAPPAGGGGPAVVQQVPSSSSGTQASVGAATITDPSQVRSPEDFKAWYAQLTPAQRADADRFFAYVGSHTPEENDRFIRFLGGLGSQPVAAPPAGSDGAPAAPGYPLAIRGEVIGRPHQGTHTLGNWESDNALDFGVPEGTPIYAVSDGTVTRTGGNNDDPSSRFNGFKLTLEGPANAWFYTHMSRLVVQDGQQVHAGDIIGYSGSANGVPHLHIGQRDGDPQATFGV